MPVITIIVPDAPEESATTFLPRDMDPRAAAHALHQAWAAVDAHCNDMVVEYSEPVG